MNNKEAIKTLNKLSRIRSDGYYEYLSNGGKEDAEFNDEMSAFDMAIQALENQPKKGKWVRVGSDIYECSECKQNVMTSDICAYNFCHGCGADMRGEEDEK